MNLANRLSRHIAASSELLVIPDKAVNSAADLPVPFPAKRGPTLCICGIMY